MDGSAALVEDVYNLEDALLAATWLNVFLRHADVLKIACLAQIVNVIGPILTTTDSLVRQTIFYPFQLFRRYARGRSLDLLVRSPSYESETYGEAPLLDVSASYDAASGQQAIFLVNRSAGEPLFVDIVWQGSAPASIGSILQIAGQIRKLPTLLLSRMPSSRGSFPAFLCAKGASPWSCLPCRLLPLWPVRSLGILDCHDVCMPRLATKSAAGCKTLVRAGRYAVGRLCKPQPAHCG